MGNLIRAEWYRLRQTPWLYLFLGVMAALALLCSSVLGKPIMPQPYAALYLMLPCGIFLVVPCVLLAYGNQYQLGILKNEVVFAIPHSHSYLARLVTAVWVGLIAAGITLSVFLLGSMLFSPAPLDWSKLAALPQLLVGSLLLWSASAAILLAMMTLLRNTAVSALLYLLSCLFWPMLLMLGRYSQDQILAGSGTFSTYLVSWLYRVHPLSCYDLFLDVGDLSILQSPPIDGSWAWAGQVAAIALGWTIFSSAVGIFALSRQEIK